jgi:hypothetical protein
MRTAPPTSGPESIDLDPELALAEPAHQSQPAVTAPEPQLTRPDPLHFHKPEDFGTVPELTQPHPLHRSNSEPDLTATLPNPLHEGGTVRRQTGHPQTFHDWVLKSNEVLATKREPFPYLPGPTFGGSASSTSSSSRGEEMTAPTSLPGTRDSLGGSSLMEVVLGAAEPTTGTALDKQVSEESQVTVVDEPKETKKADEKEVAKGYSGAWP